MVWWTIAAGIAVLALCVWFSSITATFSFHRVLNDDRLAFKIRALFGLVRYHYIIPSIQFKGLFDGILIKTKANTSATKPVQEHQQIDLPKITEFYRSSRRLIENAEGFSDWLRDALSDWRCEHLRWHTHIGLGDAPDTAVAVGMAWGAKCSLLHYALNHVQLKAQPDLAVVPQYNRTHFSTNLLAVGRIRLGKALIDSVILLWRIWKVRGGVSTWRKILFQK
ncbi:MAG: hypothetical protein K0R75_276 [Paenibacillaceae bacterium]|nr:hypothetical protein [Paenibacillaceae bacterium]